MALAFVPQHHRGKNPPHHNTIQRMLDDNTHLIQCIMEYQNKGKAAECVQYQQMLHRNLVYLATIADSNQNMQALLMAPGQPNQGPPPSMNSGQNVNMPMMQQRPGAPMGSQMPGHPMNASQAGTMMPNGMPHGSFNGPSNINGQPPSSSFPRGPPSNSMNQGSPSQYGVSQGPPGSHPQQVSLPNSSQMPNIPPQQGMPSQSEMSNAHPPNLTSSNATMPNNSSMSSQNNSPMMGMSPQNSMPGQSISGQRPMLPPQMTPQMSQYRGRPSQGMRFSAPNSSQYSNSQSPQFQGNPHPPASQSSFQAQGNYSPGGMHNNQYGSYQSPSSQQHGMSPRFSSPYNQQQRPPLGSNQSQGSNINPSNMVNNGNPMVQTSQMNGPHNQMANAPPTSSSQMNSTMIQNVSSGSNNVSSGSTSTPSTSGNYNYSQGHY